jgi:hypothetical protein
MSGGGATEASHTERQGERTVFIPENARRHGGAEARRRVIRKNHAAVDAFSDSGECTAAPRRGGRFSGNDAATRILSTCARTATWSGHHFVHAPTPSAVMAFTIRSPRLRASASSFFGTWRIGQVRTSPELLDAAGEGAGRVRSSIRSDHGPASSHASAHCLSTLKPFFSAVLRSFLARDSHALLRRYAGSRYLLARFDRPSQSSLLCHGFVACPVEVRRSFVSGNNHFVHAPTPSAAMAFTIRSPRLASASSFFGTWKIGPAELGNWRASLMPPLVSVSLFLPVVPLPPSPPLPPHRGRLIS